MGLDSKLTSGIDVDSLSQKISARSDFFRHVNGTWIDSYKLPDDKAGYGSFHKLSDDAEDHLHDILENSPESAPKSAALYNSFMNTEAIEKAGINPIREDLNRIDEANSKLELTQVLGAMDASGGPTLFSEFVFANPGDPTHYIVHISQSGLGLPDEAYYREENHKPIVEKYTGMVAKLLELAGYAKDEKQSNRFARKFVDVERRIASYHWDVVDSRDSDKTYNPRTFDQFAASLANFNFIEWVNSWQEAYNNTEASQAQPISLHDAMKDVIVYQPSFIEGIDTFWSETDLDDLKLWARVHVILQWASYLPSEFEDTKFAFYGQVLRGTPVQRERWRRAIALVDGVSGEEIGKEYVRRHFPASSKERMEQLVANLIKAYEVSITSSAWLGKETQKKALEKLSKFTPMIGYPDKWRDYSALDIRPEYSLIRNLRNASIYENSYFLAKAGTVVNKREWLMTPQTVNAYYEPTTNVIVFPAAILQPPFFNAQADDAANYGGIGAVIGHEIGHGFDDQGSKYDGDGVLQDWWTSEDRERFEKLTGALISQYDQFTPKAVADKYIAEGKADKMPHVKGAFTIGENIGDLGGVNIALKAYALALGAKDDSQEEIDKALKSAPVMDGYTGLQRFFLAYASIWRSVNRVELAEQYLQIDPHSPAEFRVNGIVRNVDRFYEAFDVNDTDDMYLAPEERVHIW
ncbi:peptidase M13 [Alloscardovia theropitheci]|uniref:Peptidase M13 n=1 Tax=Alloscardovia theropitheci TaxID=2496842 RepID=A0A4R0QRJ3_9BIFI|nr:M13-type metalloendopeptidase [Alloscardovia theropitheci]TCD54992.1 peptidase M13 [Alloscardovia theropitheci]